MTEKTSEGRRLAIRWAVGTTAATAALVFGAGRLLHHDLAQTAISAVIFVALFAGTAAFLGVEVASARRCPRCETQQTSRVGDCPSCGYDVKTRPKFVCSERHGSFEPGICPCGRRLQPWVPPDIGGHVKRSIYWGAALLVAMVVTGVVLGR